MDVSRSSFYTTLLVLTALLTLLTACGGGSSSGNELSTVGDSMMPTQGANNQSTAVSLPGLDEPNVRVPDLVIDSRGRQHAVMADIDGVVFYARCDQNCSASASWNSVAISTFDLSGSQDVVPKIQLTSNDEPRVLALRTNSVLSSNASWYYACSSTNCLSSEVWEGQAAFSAISMTEYDLTSASAFTLTQSGQPRVAWVGTPAVLSTQDDALFYASCDVDCASSGNWNRATVASFNFSEARMADLTIDNTGLPHVVFIDTAIGVADTADVIYISCESLCDTASAQWHAPVALATLDKDLLYLESARLLLDAANKPLVVAYDGGALNPLSLHQCVGDCSTVAGWQNSTPVSFDSFNEDIVRFGYGLDADYIDGMLVTQFIAKRREDPFEALLYRASCSSACSQQSSWTLSIVADTSDIDLGPAEGCAFVGTEIGQPTSLTSRASSYEAVPIWYCGSFDFIEIDASGNRELVSNPDIRFFEIATVVQVP